VKSEARMSHREGLHAYLVAGQHLGCDLCLQL
jgi:hypothetical protein